MDGITVLFNLLLVMKNLQSVFTAFDIVVKYQAMCLGTLLMRLIPRPVKEKNWKLSEVRTQEAARCFKWCLSRNICGFGLASAFFIFFLLFYFCFFT